MNGIIDSKSRGSRRSAPNKKTRSKGNNPDTNDPCYMGPVILPKSYMQTHRIKRNFSFTAQVASNGSGVIDVVIGSNPSSYASWSNYANVYHEFRVLGMQVKYSAVKSGTTYVYGPMVYCVDHGPPNSGSLGSMNVAVEHESAVLSNACQDHTIIARLEGYNEASWLSTSVPQSEFYIKFFSNLNTASTTIGQYICTLLVEFRGGV